MRRHRMSVLIRPVRKSANAARNALRKSIPKVKRVVRATPGVGALAIWIHQTIRR
jgi:lambda repressor-like predicted transcriptional regulator